MPAIPNHDDVSLRDRSFVVAVVALVHVLLLWSYVSFPSQSKPVRNEMSVSVTLPNPPQTAVVVPKPVVKPKPVEPQPVQKAPVPETIPETPVATPAPAPSPSPHEAGASPAQPENVVAAPPGLPDREPDYQAAYLNNPLPVYPMVARRMGWQGRVVLNVEVLANGLPGQVKLHQSSGREVLDNTAIKAVRGWRFVAARQNGQVVAKWFLVPIPFILKEE